MERSDRGLGILLVTVILFLFAYTSAVVFVPLAAVELRADPAAVGWVVALPGALGFVLAMPSAALSNRFGRRRMLGAGFLTLAVTAVGYLLAPSFMWLVPGQLGLGLAMITYWPSALAAFSEGAGSRGQATVQGANTLVQGVAGFLGAGAAGLLAASLGLASPLVGMLLAAAAGLVLVIGFTETIPAAARRPNVELRATVRRARRLLALDRSVAVGAFSLLPWSLLWWVAGASFFVLHVRESGHGAEFAGGLLAVRIAAASGVRLAFALITRRLSLSLLMIGGNVLAALGLAFAVVSPAPGVLIASAIVQGVGLGVVLPASNVVVSTGTSDTDRVIGLAISAGFNNLAILASAPLLGLAAAVGGTSAALLLAAVLAVATVAVLWFWQSRAD